MNEDEKRAWKAVKRAFWLMAAPMLAAVVFTCVRASSNGRWLYYSVFFLVCLSRRIFIILLRIMSRLELELRNNAEYDHLSFFCAVIYNLVIELMILGFLNFLLFYLKKPLFGWDCFVFLIPIVLLQIGIRCFQQATECLYHVRRLHHAAYDRDNWIVYGSTFAGLVKASTYSIPYGKDDQEVGIVLIEKREKERYNSEEDYLSSGASDFLFLPVFLIKSSCEVQPPVIQYDREQAAHPAIPGRRRHTYETLFRQPELQSAGVLFQVPQVPATPVRLPEKPPSPPDILRVPSRLRAEEIAVFAVTLPHII